MQVEYVASHTEGEDEFEVYVDGRWSAALSPGAYVSSDTGNHWNETEPGFTVSYGESFATYKHFDSEPEARAWIDGHAEFLYES